MSRIRTRLERLERQRPARASINWDNFLARSPEEIVPDGIVNWNDFLFGPPRDNETCPIEEAIRLAGLPTPDPRLGDPPLPCATSGNDHA